MSLVVKDILTDQNLQLENWIQRQTYNYHKISKTLYTGSCLAIGKFLLLEKGLLGKSFLEYPKILCLRNFLKILNLKLVSFMSLGPGHSCY